MERMPNDNPHPLWFLPHHCLAVLYTEKLCLTFPDLLHQQLRQRFPHSAWSITATHWSSPLLLTKLQHVFPTYFHPCFLKSIPHWLAVVSTYSLSVIVKIPTANESSEYKTNMTAGRLWPVGWVVPLASMCCCVSSVGIFLLHQQKADGDGDGFSFSHQRSVQSMNKC